MAPNGKGVLQRVEDLEAQVQMLNQQLRVSQNSIRQLLNVFTGLVDVMGGDELDKKISEAIQARQEKQRKAAIDAAKNQIAQLLEAGQLKKVDGITKDSIVTFAEYAVEFTPPTEEGKEPEGKRGPCTDEFAQMPAAQFTPDVFKDLEGKPVGYVYRKGNVEIEISAIYEMVPADLNKQIEEAGEKADSDGGTKGADAVTPDAVEKLDKAADENAAKASEAQLGTTTPPAEGQAQ